MASLFKPLVMATYLSRPNVRDRGLHGWERDLLGPMIRCSNNEPATRLRDMLGPGPITAMARKAEMKDFSYHSVWGLSRTEPARPGALLRTGTARSRSATRTTRATC